MHHEVEAISIQQLTGDDMHAAKKKSNVTLRQILGAAYELRRFTIAMESAYKPFSIRKNPTVVID